MQLPNEFYTIETLFTLTGATTGVWVITSVIGYLIPGLSSNIKKWLGLVLAFVFVFLGVAFGQDKSPLIWVVAFVNSFLVYLTAVGANTITAHAASRGSNDDGPFRPVGRSSKRGGFSEPWW